MWPKHDEKLIIENIIPFVVQINGKKRQVINIERSLSEQKIIELIKKDKIILKFLDNKNIKKKIFVPERLINIII